jgi:hypothetical protein
VRARLLDLARLGLLVAVAASSCKEDIPRPPAENDDAGGEVTPADAAPDGPGRTDVAPDRMPAPTCGTPGLACCPGNDCTGGGCCVSGQCVANGTPCRSDATCLNGSCGGCGGLTQGMPQACCEPAAGAPAGTAPSCTGSRAVCSAMGGGTCRPCGAMGQSCCADNFCEAGMTCDPTRQCVRK